MFLEKPCRTDQNLALCKGSYLSTMAVFMSCREGKNQNEKARK
jgi:hypothetical protein